MNDRQLRIRLAADANAADRVAIRSSRPVHAARIFANRPIGEVHELLPRLFSVCGAAQASAARRALARATGRGDEGRDDAADRFLLLMESAREHLWRIIIDWPGFTGHAIDDAAAKRMQRLLPRAASAGSLAMAEPGATRAAIEALEILLHDAVFGIPAEDWLAIETAGDLGEWADEQDTAAARLLARVIDRDWAAVGATAVSFLPELEDAELEARLSADDADAFIAAPEWQGFPRETTPLSRNRDAALIDALHLEFGAGLLTRLAALLVELARVPAAMQADRRPVPQQDTEGGELPANTGIGQVDAARGRLVHRAIVDGDRVRQYQILAPTEWNFHPRGVLAASLDTLDASDPETLSAQASLLTATIDPCVGYDLRVH